MTPSELIPLYRKQYVEARDHEQVVTAHRLGRMERELSSFTVRDVDQFLFTLPSPASRNRYRSILKHLVRWGIERDYLIGTETKLIVVLRPERESGARSRRMTREEEEKLRAHMSQDLADLFTGAIDTGLRKQALFNLTFADVVGDTLVVRAGTQKQRQGQIIPLTKRLAEVIERRHQPWSHFIFETKGWRMAWDCARELAGVPDLHWHDLRGEFASRLEEAHVPVSLISSLLGHASVAMTQKYLRPRTNAFREAIDQMERQR